MAGDVMRFTFVRAAGAKGAVACASMRKRDLLKALSDPDLALSISNRPEGRFFFMTRRSQQCSSILARLVRKSLSRESLGNRDALPLPDVELPMIF